MKYARRITRLAPAAWLIPLILSSTSAAAEPPARPRVPAFERFFSKPGPHDAQAGRLLLGELNCTSCHKAEEKTSAWISNKQAPILSLVGSRVRPEYLKAFLTNPAAVKPGTTMPNMFAHVPAELAMEQIEQLVHFLASTGSTRDIPIRPAAIAAGENTYQDYGCVACHAPRDGKTIDPATSAPLGELDAKYTLIGLSVFLKDPLGVRPSGRMPSFNLDINQAIDLSSFILKNLKAAFPPNLHYSYYEGAWQSIPDFKALKPELEGETTDFDLHVGKRKQQMAFLFEGYLHIGKEGEYTFDLSSDDGSTLRIDEKLVVDNDGVHASRSKRGTTRLTAGPHKLDVGYFDGGGNAELEVQFEGPGVSRQALSPFVSITPEKPAIAETFKPDPKLVEQGRTLFSSIGCASCHQFRDEKGTLSSMGSKLALNALRKPAVGCLADQPPEHLPVYGLDNRQREAISQALAELTPENIPEPTTQDLISSSLYTFNCYACHARDGVGGVERQRDPYFLTTQKEMGDEGRLPPHLNGVGAKLNPEWFARVLAEGAKDRLYMLTRMPNFGSANVGKLANSFAAVDHIDPVPDSHFDLPETRVKAIGRFLVGSQAYGCGSCHGFQGYKANGIQAISMSIMARRLRRDWFHHYVTDPQSYRPGTRMPASWPRAESSLKDVLNGKSIDQIEAVWRYLGDGDRAAVPYGLTRTAIPLVDDKEAIIYRNFIQGAGVRAIGVGYPQKANLAFDANDLRLALIWQGDFIDASRHRSARGEGFEPPLGDNILSFPSGPSLARLEKPDTPWPQKPTREQLDTYRFLGYRLAGPERTPIFKYRFDNIDVEDSPAAMADPNGAKIKRTLLFSARNADRIENAYLRAALGSKIEPLGDRTNRYKIDDQWELDIESQVAPVLRKSEAKTELLVPIGLDRRTGTAKIVETFSW